MLVMIHRLLPLRLSHSHPQTHHHRRSHHFIKQHLRKHFLPLLFLHDRSYGDLDQVIDQGINSKRKRPLRPPLPFLAKLRSLTHYTHTRTHKHMRRYLGFCGFKGGRAREWTYFELGSGFSRPRVFFGCCDQGAGVAGWTVTVEGFLGGSRSLGSGTGLGNKARKPDVWKRKEVVVFLKGLLCVLWRVI